MTAHQRDSTALPTRCVAHCEWPLKIMERRMVAVSQRFGHQSLAENPISSGQRQEGKEEPRLRQPYQDKTVGNGRTQDAYPAAYDADRGQGQACPS